MTCNSEEKGEYTFPAGEFNRFKKAFKAKWDEHMEQRFQKAMKVYERFAGHDYKALDDDHRFAAMFSDHDEHWDVSALFLRGTKAGKLAKPLQKDLKAELFAAKIKGDHVDTYGAVFDCDGGQLTIDFKNRRVEWYVDRSNRAVERARRHPIAVWFFKFLGKVKWTGSTGGLVRYTDEYREDNGPCCPSEVDLHGYALKQWEDQFKSLGKPRRSARARQPGAYW